MKKLQRKVDTEFLILPVYSLGVLLYNIRISLLEIEKITP